MAQVRIAGAEDVRQRNLGRLLRVLHVEGATSRAELAARTGLNRSTIGVLTTALAEAGLVRECAPVGSGHAGRPSIVVAPRPSTYALAVDVGVERLTAARVGLGGTVLQRSTLSQARADHDPLRTVARVQQLLDELLADTCPDDVCVGLGVSVCGLVREEDGTVLLAPNIGWADVPLRWLLADRLVPELAVRVGNEADLGALAEHLRGAGAGVQDMVYLSGEVGVGGGIVLDGRPLRGAGGLAGELGHMVVNPSGRLCECGRLGCWETEIGEEAVLRATGRPAGAGRGAVLAACAAQDSPARQGLEQVGRWLGLGVANLVNLLSPELVVFGGLTGHVFPAVEPVVRRALAEALPAPRSPVRLELPGLGADSSLLGAAELVFAGVLADPLGALHRAAWR